MGELLPEAELLLEEVTASGGATEVAPGQLTIPGLTRGMPTALKAGLFFTAVGTSALAIAFVETFGALAQKATSWLPFFGQSIARGIEHGVQVLTNRIGLQYRGVDYELGYGFFELADEVRLLGADVLAAGFVALRLSKIIGALSRKPDLAPIVHNTQTVVRAQGAKVTEVVRKTVYITKVLAHPATAHELQQIHALQTQVHHQAVEIAQLQKQAHTTPHPSTLAQAMPIVALGLAGLGLNASRCEGPRTFDKALCEAGPQGLGSLLNLLSFGALLMGLVELAEWEGPLVGDAASLVHDFWRV